MFAHFVQHQSRLGGRCRQTGTESPAVSAVTPLAAPRTSPDYDRPGGVKLKLNGNTILVTGGGTGIGRSLAESLHALGNRVIIAGRRQGPLDEVASANPGMHPIAFDVQDPEDIQAATEAVIKKYPELNVLINNAGIMRAERLTDEPVDLADSEAIIATNLLGPIRLTAALLPHLKKQPNAAILNVSSSLAFVPFTLAPTYCATKAALHSWTQSLRFQLRAAKVEVIEIIPPYVATDLMNGKNDPRAMPLREYIAETMEILRHHPTPPEICVQRAKVLRFAAEEDRYASAFQGLNLGLTF
jgi:uncharacterized oxidoreductase